MNNKILKMDGIDAMIFDLDGVVTQTAKIHAKAWKRLFDEYGECRQKNGKEPFRPYDENEDYVRYIDGKPRHEGVRSFLSSRNIHLPDGKTDDPPGKETVSGLAKRKNELFLGLLEKNGVDVYDDTLALIHKWRNRGLKTAIVSSSRNCKAVLETAGLSGLFDERVDGVTAREMQLKGKPNPDIFIKAVELLGVEPSHAVIFEDAVSGVQAGKAGHFAAVIGISRHGRDNDLWENGADIVVNTLEDLQTEARGQLNNLEADEPPSALEHINDISRRLEGKKMALFLDYDGTLTPIVDHPEDARLSDGMRSLLTKLASLCTVAVISGRDLDDVRNLVDLENLIYAGSHGFDIAGPNDLRMQQEQGKKCLPALDEAEQELYRLTRQISGARVERKRFSIALHYRNVTADDIPRVEKIADEVLANIPKLRKGLGKKVIELRPDADWDKGKALMWLMEKLNMDQRGVLPLYLGDDITDEDAFSVLHDRGIGILVGRHGEKTAAKFRLNNVSEVQRLLNNLAEILELNAQ